MFPSNNAIRDITIVTFTKAKTKYFLIFFFLSLVFPVPSSFHAFMLAFFLLIWFPRFNEKFLCRFIFFNTKSIYQYWEMEELHSLTKNEENFFFPHLKGNKKKETKTCLGMFMLWQSILRSLMVAPDFIVADVTIFNT